MKAMMNKVELMDNELDMVNGGGIFDDFTDWVKKGVDTIVEKTEELIDDVKNVIRPSTKPDVLINDPLEHYIPPFSIC